VATNRISIKDLERLTLIINEATGSPVVPYADGKAQIGNYHISQAYGGVCLHRMHSEGGAITTPLCSYHEPKRDLYNRMVAFIAGIELK
jgi:hypothetical protein